MTKWIKRVLLSAAVLFVVAQVVRPEHTNPPSNPNEHITAKLAVHPEVAATLQRACSDCHSNNTVWPWYSNVAPASWLVANDVKEGRNELNFSLWGKYSSEEQQELLGKMCKEVKEGEMPDSLYTLAHPKARLSSGDRQALCSWTNTLAATLPDEKEEEERD